MLTPEQIEERKHEPSIVIEEIMLCAGGEPELSVRRMKLLCELSGICGDWIGQATALKWELEIANQAKARGA